MKASKFFFLFPSILFCNFLFAQKNDVRIPDVFVSQKTVPTTPVKDQAASLTCWSFSTTSLFESQCMKEGKGELDISEMFTVRNIYIEKAKNYIMRQGKAQFSEGGLGHDPVRAIATYGAMPESEYSGLIGGQKKLNHVKLADTLKEFLDAVLKKIPLSATWLDDYIAILDRYMGKPPVAFDYNGKQYTPETFASQVMKFKADDYVNITSFTHHPYYESFILEQPDNFSNGYYYNLPLNEMTDLVKAAVNNGYSIMWDADVSNGGWMAKNGYAMFPGTGLRLKEDLDPEYKEAETSVELRQKLFENLTTSDDHLMHIVGVEKTKSGKTFFLVKNSWGEVGPFQGYVHVSESYFNINTVSLVVPRAAISKSILAKLKK